MPSKKPYKFVPLKAQEKGLPSEIRIRCNYSGRVARWDEAVSLGWVADANGTPFNAYYSPEAVQYLSNPSNVF